MGDGQHGRQVWIRRYLLPMWARYRPANRLSFSLEDLFACSVWVGISCMQTVHPAHMMCTLRAHSMHIARELTAIGARVDCHWRAHDLHTWQPCTARARQTMCCKARQVGFALTPLRLTNASPWRPAGTGMLGV